MNMHAISKSLLVITFALSCSTTAVAAPMVCDPLGIAPPSEEASGLGWFERLFATSGKPQPFQAAVATNTPTDEGCSLSGELRPVASDLRGRDRNRAFD